MCYRSCWLSADLRHKYLGVHFGTPESHLLWLENYTPQYNSGSQHKQGGMWPGRPGKLSQITGDRKVHHQTLVILSYMDKDTIFALAPSPHTHSGIRIAWTVNWITPISVHACLLYSSVCLINTQTFQTNKQRNRYSKTCKM